LGVVSEVEDVDAVLRGSGGGGNCLGMPACRSWLRSEMKGIM